MKGSKCSQCGEAMRDAEALQRHMKKAHGGGSGVGSILGGDVKGGIDMGLEMGNNPFDEIGKSMKKHLKGY